MPRGGAHPLAREANADPCVRAVMSQPPCRQPPTPPRCDPGRHAGLRPPSPRVAAAAMRATCTVHRASASAGGERPRGAAHRARAELEALRAAVTRLAGGEGAIVVLAAPAGPRQDRAARARRAARRREAGCLVRRAAPGPARAPLRASASCGRCWRRRCATHPSERRARLLEGAAAPAGALLLDGAVPDADATMAIAHSVLWLCSALADERAARARGRRRPLGRPPLAGGARLPGAADRRPAAAHRRRRPCRRSRRGRRTCSACIGGVRAATVLHPQPLTPSRRGAAHPPRGAVDTPVEVCRDCHRAVGRQPVAARRAQPSDRRPRPGGASTPPKATPPPLSAIARNVVRRRLAELTPRDRAVVEALAVIGEGAPRQVVAAVAGVALDELGAGARRAAWPPGCSAPAARASPTT